MLANEFVSNSAPKISLQIVIFLLVVAMHVGLALMLIRFDVQQTAPVPQMIWMQARTIINTPSQTLIEDKSEPTPVLEKINKNTAPVVEKSNQKIEKAKPMARKAEKIISEPTTIPTATLPITTSTAVDPPEKAIEPVAQPVITPVSFAAAYLHNPAPPYPVVSKKMKEQGRVILLVHVTAEGRADQVSIKQSSGFARLDQTAMTAVRNWQFVPAQRDNQKIDAFAEVPINFKLDEN